MNFLDRLIITRIIIDQLKSYNPFRPYDDSQYSYKNEGVFTSIKIKFPFKPEMHEKYILKFNNETKEFTIYPDDLNIKKDSLRYKKIKKAILFARKRIKEKQDFYDSVYKSRKEYSELIQIVNENKNISDDYFVGKRKKTKESSSSSRSDSSCSSRDITSKNNCD